MILNTFAAMTLGLVLNMMVGKPQFFVSVEQTMTSVAGKIKKFLANRYEDTPEAHSAAGKTMLVLVILLFTGITLLLLVLFYIFIPVVGIIFEAIVLWFCLDIKTTRLSAYGIMRCVRAGNIEGAQKRLSKFTGVDCSEMSRDEVIKTTVEKISDRCTTGGFSPLVYITVFGGAGAMFYKTVCVLHHEMTVNSEEYADYDAGVKSLWGILSIIPAKIGALMLKLDVKILSLDKNNANRIYKHDSRNASPQFLGQARSVIAGSLGIRLNVEEYYDGMIMRNRVIGTELKKCEPMDIYWANQLLYGSTFAMYLLCSAVRIILHFIF